MIDNMILILFLLFNGNNQSNVQPKIESNIVQTNVDPTGFTQLLNQIRYNNGLSLVSYDPNLVTHAFKNNQFNNAYGLNHHWTGGYGQVTAYAYDMHQALANWMASPGHHDIIMATNLVSIGYNQLGPYFTVSTTQDFSQPSYLTYYQPNYLTYYPTYYPTYYYRGY